MAQQPRLTTQQRIFVLKTFYETNNNSETTRLFCKEHQRQIRRENVSD